MHSDQDSIPPRSASPYRVSAYHASSGTKNKCKEPQLINNNGDSCCFEVGKGTEGDTRFACRQEASGERANSAALWSVASDENHSKDASNNNDIANASPAKPKRREDIGKEIDENTCKKYEIMTNMTEEIIGQPQEVFSEELATGNINGNATTECTDTEGNSTETDIEMPKEISNETEGKSASKGLQVFSDRSNEKGITSTETRESPVTLRPKNREGNSIDSFTASTPEMLKRRSAEIAQLRRKLEAKMKRKSLQVYSLSDDEGASLFNEDEALRTRRRPLSAIGHVGRFANGDEVAFSNNSSCNSSNYPSCFSTPNHRQRFREQRLPVHGIDTKKLRYLLGDAYNPPAHRCCMCFNHTVINSCCRQRCCDHRKHSMNCSEYENCSPCHNNRLHSETAKLDCPRSCNLSVNHPSSYPSHYHATPHHPCGHCMGPESHNSPVIYDGDYHRCFHRCPTSVTCPEPCKSHCNQICHASDAHRSLSKACIYHVASTPSRTPEPSSPQHTCRCTSPYQDAMDGGDSQYHTPVGSPRPVKSIQRSHAASTAQGTGEGDGRINYYPNCDPTIWLRSCEKEITEPLHGTKSGEIPKWLKGSLIRNGPGRIKVGDHQYNHVFDGSALLHRFHFRDGEVTYQNKFLKSRSYLSDTKAQRIVVNYFGTKAHPDPCKTILQNVASKFTFEEHFTDNAQISLYPYGDGIYALTETPFIFRVDPETLDTHEKVNLTQYVSVLTHTAHPHVDRDGTVYNIGQGVGPLGPKYHICKFPKAKTDRKGKVKTPFEQAEIVGSVNARWRLNPCYMHSFAMTPNYFVIIEQPMVVSVSRILRVILKQDALIDALQWWEKETKIHVVRRDTGAVITTQYVTETFFFLHTINAYEDRDHIVLDIAAYKNADMLNCMFVEALKNAAYDPTYAQMFRGRPKRWVLPLHPDKDADSGANLVTLPNTKCRGRWTKKNVIYLTPELLSDIGCEVPRIHYDEYNGRPYQYFYSICSDVDHPSPGTLVKVDVVNKSHVEWSEDNVYPSEPIFVPRPGAQREDDGVVVAALLRAKGLDNQVCLLVLDATSFTELGRVEFLAPGPVPKCLHGWFVQDGSLKVRKDASLQEGQTA